MAAEIIENLIGKIFTEIHLSENMDRLSFISEDKEYEFVHDQDCCEQVYIDDIVGDLTDLLNSPILTAEERYNSDDPMGKDNNWGTFTWTFYEFATNKGSVTVKWYGESNGYYSESVSLYVHNRKAVKK
jgi:hypothetical protein